MPHFSLGNQIYNLVILLLLVYLKSRQFYLTLVDCDQVIQDAQVVDLLLVLLNSLFVHLLLLLLGTLGEDRLESSLT